VKDAFTGAVFHPAGEGFSIGWAQMVGRWAQMVAFHFL